MSSASTIDELGNLEGTLYVVDNDGEGCYPWDVSLIVQVAVASIVFILAAAIYVVSDRKNAHDTKQHWEDICKQILRERDNVKHKILDPPSSSQETEVGIKTLSSLQHHTYSTVVGQQSLL